MSTIDPASLTARLNAESASGALELTRTAAVPSIPMPTTLDIASIRAALLPIKNWIDQKQGAAGSVLDKALTLRDLVNEGGLSINLGGGRSFTGAAAGSAVDFGSGYSDPRPVFLVPPPATNLTAAGAFKNVILDWDLVDYANHSYTEIWRNGANLLGTAALLNTSNATFYADANVVVGATYYYWVRAVAVGGATGPFNAVGGTVGALLTIGNTDLGPLAVTAEKLSQGTYPNINLVPNPGAEDGTAAWALAGTEIAGAGGVFTADTTQKYGGTTAFKLTKAAMTDGVGATCIAFPVIPGETYSVKVKLLGSSAGGTGAFIRMQQRAVKPPSGYITNGGDVRDSYTDLASDIAAPAVWTAYEFSYAVPAGVYWAALTIYNFIDAPVGLWWDDCSVGRQITASFLAANSIAVGTAAIQNGALVNAMIANLAVDNAKIANATITGGKIAVDTVTATNIDSRSLTIKDAAGTVIFSAGLASDQSDNLIRNPSGPSLDGWSGTNMSGGTNGIWSSGDARWLRINSRDTLSTISIPVAPGQEFYIQSDVLPDFGGAAVYDLVLQVFELAGDGAAQIGATAVATRLATVTGQTTMSGNYTVPAGCYFIRFYFFEAGFGPFTGTTGFYVRNITLRRKISSANQSTYISSLNANVIVAGSITTAKILVGAATVASDAAGTSSSASFIAVSSFTAPAFNVVAITTTGAPVYIVGDWNPNVSMGGTLAKIVSCRARIRCNGTLIREVVSNIIPAPNTTGGQAVSESRSLIVRHTPGAGSQTYSIEAYYEFYNSVSALVAQTGSATPGAYLVATENKV